MPKFHTTAQTTAAIERIIENAQREIVLISPYLQISTIFLERLIDAGLRKVNIKICYGKEDLSTSQQKEISTIPGVSLYFMKNLHAKCYYNETELIVTSMNLFSYSEKNNREMGIYMSLSGDEILYRDAQRECLSILQHAQAIHVTGSKSVSATTVKTSTTNLPEVNYRNWKEKLVEELGLAFGEKISFRDGPELSIKSQSHTLECFIVSEKNFFHLVISKILTGLLYDFLRSSPVPGPLPPNARFVLEKGNRGSYDMAYCELTLPLKTERLNYVAPAELTLIFNFITGYSRAIHDAVKRFKNLAR